MLTGGQALYVLNRLLADRRIHARDVAACVAAMQADIEELEARLNWLRGAVDEQAPSLIAPHRAGGHAARAASADQQPRRRRQAPVSAATRASRQLQGRYLGLIRQIPASRRGKYRKLAKQNGREAAVKAMSAALGR